MSSAAPVGTPRGVAGTTDEGGLAASRPSALRRAGETALWLLIVGPALVGLLHILAALHLVVLPLLLAVVLATFLVRPVRWLRRRNWSPGAAALAVVAAAVSTTSAIFLLLAPLVVSELGALDLELTSAIDAIQASDSPLPVSGDQLSRGIETVQDRLAGSVDALARQALVGAVIVVEVLAGIGLAIVILFFLLKDGDRMWQWLLALAPARRRRGMRTVGERSWAALGGFVRGQTLVALFDAVLIGLALVVIGVPLALPLAVLTFFGAYVPVIGATITGRLAVALANGLTAAIFVLAVIVAVQQFEGNVLQPVVVGRAVDVHPVVILLGVTGGAVLAGIIGAMIAAPLIAVAAAILTAVRDDRHEPSPADDVPLDRLP